MTPRLTDHARARCAEMGISTKVAKSIVRDADLRRPARPDEPGISATSRKHPDYAVVYVEGDVPVILTVLFNTADFFERAGTTYIPTPA